MSFDDPLYDLFSAFHLTQLHLDEIEHHLVRYNKSILEKSTNNGPNEERMEHLERSLELLDRSTRTAPTSINHELCRTFYGTSGGATTSRDGSTTDPGQKDSWVGIESPITKPTLSELDVNKIVNNPKLRHDINFDPGIQFRPNVEGVKQSRTAQKAYGLDDLWGIIELTYDHHDMHGTFIPFGNGFQRPFRNHWQTDTEFFDWLACPLLDGFPYRNSDLSILSTALRDGLFALYPNETSSGLTLLTLDELLDSVKQDLCVFIGDFVAQYRLVSSSKQQTMSKILCPPPRAGIG